MDGRRGRGTGHHPSDVLGRPRAAPDAEVPEVRAVNVGRSACSYGFGEAGVSAHVPPGRYPAPSRQRRVGRTRIPGVALSGGRAGNRFPHRAPVRTAVLRSRPSASSTASCRGSSSTPACLALAEDRPLPLLERAKFLAIFSQNLDEFFQVRVSGLMEQLDGRPAHHHRPTASTSSTSSARSGRRVDELVGRARPRCSPRRSRPRSRTTGIRFADWDELADDDRAHLDDDVRDSIFPVLTPLAVDPAHPFPYISNLSLNLAVTVRDPSSGEERFARVKVPAAAPPLRRAARRRALRAARAGHRRASSTRCSRGWRCSRTTRSASNT